MKAKIDEVYPYNSLYRAICQPYVMTSPEIWTNNAPFLDLKDVIYELYNNWTTYSDLDFGYHVITINNYLNRWDRDLSNIRLIYIKDNTISAIEPTVPYSAGEKICYKTKKRNRLSR